jgi:hypothetical protein
MPMNRSLYPSNWPAIARAVKDAADWRCQHCGMQCRRPGEPFDTHRRTMSVAHLNHEPSDCRTENLAAWCAACHLRYDAAHHAQNAARTRRTRRLLAGQQSFIEEL